MNPHWRSFLESAEALFDSDSTELLSFGDAPGELLAAKQQTVVVPLTHLALIEAMGKGPVTFVYGSTERVINNAEALRLYLQKKT